jgi:PBSX family phage terminase large subunit
MICNNCFTTDMQIPANQHIAYVECPNCGAIELTYIPQDYQQNSHEVPITEVWDEENQKWRKRTQILGFFGGYGSGKSRTSLTEVVLRALQNPKGTGLLTAPTLQQLKRTTIKTFFNEVCPPPLITRYNKSDGEIELVNGFTFYTIPSDDEEKLRSINAGIIHMEEASGINRTIYDQLLTRMRDPFVEDRLFAVCSNPDLGWIKDLFADNIPRKDPNHPQHDEYNDFITTFIWPTELNKHLPPDFIELNCKGKPEWWIKRYMMGSFEHSEGMVYPNFAKCLTTEQQYLIDRNIKAIPDNWEKFITLDHGLRNPTAVYWNAIDPDNGIVVTYDEYYVAGALVPEHAKVIKPKIDAIPAGRIRFMVADPSIRNKTDPVNGKSVQSLYQEYGMYFAEGNNSIETGILRVNSYINRGKWVILRDKCPNLAKEGIGYKFPEISMDDKKNPDEKPVKKDDHAMDSCFVAGTLIETNKGQIPIEKIRVGNKVLTREGYKKVIDWGMTNKEATVYTVKFSNGSSIKATGNHPVRVDGKGFVPVDSLRYGDIVNVSRNWEDSKCQKQNLLSMKGLSTDAIQMRNRCLTEDISDAQGEKGTYITKFIKIILEKFQKTTTFTIRTETREITNLIILKWFLHLNIYRSMEKCLQKLKRSILMLSDHLQKNGISQRRVLSGIENTDEKLLQIWLNETIHVNAATKRLVKNPLEKINSVQTTVNLNGAETTNSMMWKKSVNTAESLFSPTSTTKRDSVDVHVVSVAIDDQKQAVYNISVEDLPEYYANGVLVHNCRYGFMRLPDDPELLKTLAYAPPKRYSSTQKEDYDDYDEDEYGERDYMSYV